MPDPVLFHDRIHAGRKLALALRQFTNHSSAIVLGLPRGGVPVASAVASALRLELDVLLVRKLGLPGYEEFAMGAITRGGLRVLNQAALAEHAVADADLARACARELAEIERREQLYRGMRPALELAGRTAILVDDGLATGSTMRIAVHSARQLGARCIIAAVPVGPSETCSELASEVDGLVCLQRPRKFFSVSHCYRHFDQTSDDEVRKLLTLAWREQARRQPSLGAVPPRTPPPPPMP